MLKKINKKLISFEYFNWEKKIDRASRKNTLLEIQSKNKKLKGKSKISSFMKDDGKPLIKIGKFKF